MQYSPLRHSPNRGVSNSPSRVAAALQESHGVGSRSYGNSRSPMNISNNNRVASISPDDAAASAGVENSYRGRAANPPMDENLVKMRKSCERIAAVLGIKDG